ncbi:MAG TPA: biotin--[acetyl-CoA-carboxylase] ligase [Clostridiales bacterium]|nr:biotin--[acetyl-CoA-carboxylase] ligase [Clostridiales bacterium]
MNRELNLTAKTLGRPSFYLESVDSTNRWMKENGASLPHGAVCWTGFQTAGRGRLGRSWQTGNGDSLAMSILFKPGFNSSLLPLVCGLGVSKALQKLTSKEFLIKWPNDIICEGHKVCGILCENMVNPSGGFAVAGIGINLLQSERDFKSAGLPHAGSLKMFCGEIPNIAKIAAEVINCIEPLWMEFAEKGFGSIKREYESKCLTLKKEVNVLSVSGRLICSGYAAGISDDGSLLVDSGNGPEPVNAGEVSVRTSNGYI